MEAAPVLGVVCRGLSTMAMLALAAASELKAQVGLSSGVSQIALTARAAPRATMEQSGPSSETGSYGTGKEISVKVRVSANTGYRLLVVGTAPAARGRLWVRDAGGKFRELTSGSAVMVARDLRAVGEWMGEVLYRTESLRPVESRHVLPVRYEIRVEPTI